SLRDLLVEKGFHPPPTRFEAKTDRLPSPRQAIVPPLRSRYLAEIAAEIRNYHAIVAEQAGLAREIQQLKASRQMLEAGGAGGEALAPLIGEREERQDSRARKLIENSPRL